MISPILLSTVTLTNPAEDFFSTSTKGLIRGVQRSVCRYSLGISWVQAAESGYDSSPSVGVHGVTLMKQADEEKPNGCSLEWGPGYFGSISVCGDPQWVTLSESWSEFKYVDFHQLLKNLLEDQKKIPRVMKIIVLLQLGWICFRYRQTECF